MKLDSRSRIGQWIGFKKVSNTHQIFWPDNHSVTLEWNIKFDNNDLLNFCALLPKGEKGDIGHQSTQDFATTSTNPIDHNALWQEVAEPIPAKLIPEDQNPQLNNYLGTNFNRADAEEPAAHSQQIHKPSAYVSATPKWLFHFRWTKEPTFLS